MGDSGYAEYGLCESTESADPERKQDMRTTVALVLLLVLVPVNSGCVGLESNGDSLGKLPFVLKPRGGHTGGGDEIVITEVRGDSQEYRPGATYLVKGHYKLRSHEDAVLTQWCSNGWVQEIDSENSEPSNGGSLTIMQGTENLRSTSK